MLPPPRYQPIVLLILISLILLLAACQSGDGPLPAVGWLPESLAGRTATFTPFQANSPTPRPTFTSTLTLTQTPTLTPTPTVTFTPVITLTSTMPPCIEQQGRVERQEVAFAEGSPPMGFQVYFPPCFDPSGKTRYPVLYMIHGQSFKDDQWVRLGIADAADTLIAQKAAPPFMIVMPHEKNTYADIYETPFRSSVVDGLVPWIDSQYPTCAKRECRAIGGLSRGGAWALHLGFTRWDLFGSVGLHSTPPFIGDPDRFPGWLKNIPPDQIPRIYMDTGRHDYYLAPTLQFEALLVSLQVPHEWYLFTGTHNEEYWSAHVGDYLQWYTQPW